MINRTYAVAWTPLDGRETQIVRTVVKQAWRSNTRSEQCLLGEST